MTLLEKLKAATEGSRELDVLLWAHFDNREVFEKGGVILARHREPPHDTCKLGTIDPGKHSSNFQEAWADPPFPNFTTSIDAALALVRRKYPEHHWSLDGSDGRNSAHFVFWKKLDDWDGVHSTSETEELAICIALVKAEGSE